MKYMAEITAEELDEMLVEVDELRELAAIETQLHNPRRSEKLKKIADNYEGLITKVQQLEAKLNKIYDSCKHSSTGCDW